MAMSLLLLAVLTRFHNFHLTLVQLMGLPQILFLQQPLQSL